MIEIASLLALFGVAFGAATLLPMPSEVVFVPMVLQRPDALWIIVTVASVGNTLGSCVNYALGRGAERFRGTRWFPASDDALAKAQGWFARWGVWALLFSWAPLGDALTVVAGVMRTPLWLFLLLCAIGKTARYAVLGWVTVTAAG